MIKLKRSSDRFDSFICHAGFAFFVLQQNGFYADALNRKKSDMPNKCICYSDSFQRVKVFKGS